MTAGGSRVAVIIPSKSGNWIHLWSGYTLCPSDTSGIYGKWIVPSEIGFPSVLYRSNSSSGAALRAYVQEKGYDKGYIWEDYDPSRCFDSKLSYNQLRSSSEHRESIWKECIFVAAILCITFHILSRCLQVEQNRRGSNREIIRTGSFLAETPYIKLEEESRDGE
jgi:hypothetical protein